MPGNYLYPSLPLPFPSFTNNHLFLSDAGVWTFSSRNADYQIEWVLTPATAGVPALGTTVYPSVVTNTYFTGQLFYTEIVPGSASLTISSTGGPSTPVALQFVPITPCRVVDTREAAGPFGGLTIAGQTSRDFALPNSTDCTIPASAAAYSLNAAVVPPGPLGYVTVWPTGDTQPTVSTLNSLDGRIKSNAAIVPAGVNGAISVFASDTTDVVLDINGYFIGSSSSGLDFYPVTPCRVADTRKANGAFGSPSLMAGFARYFPITQSACNIPSTAQAYSLNFTAVPSGPLGYLTAWPAAQARPVVSTLNDVSGVVTANAAIVPAGSNGDISVYVTNNTDLVIDVNGYFAPPGVGGLSLYTLTPCRVLDSREPSGSLPFEGETTLSVTGSTCAPPAIAQAFVFNATAVPPAPLGYLTLWADGGTQPTVSP